MKELTSTYTASGTYLIKEGDQTIGGFKDRKTAELFMNVCRLEQLADQGYCPNLLNDDNGHWALVFDGFQQVPEGKEPQDIETSFFVIKEFWKPTIQEAIEYSLKELKQ
jgi:hypothetical protein